MLFLILCLGFPTQTARRTQTISIETQDRPCPRELLSMEASILTTDGNRPTNYLWPLDATILLNNYNNYNS